jgi:TPR repeat protein
MCENGYFYTVNPKKAFEWYQKAAEAGDEVAMRNLGYCYKDATGVEKDDSLAFTWFCKAASRGDTSAIKQVINCYKNGLGVEKDDQKVVEWYEKLISVGETSALVDLGHYYETVIVDYEKALLYYRKAAESGNIVGQYNMGIMYQYGKGVEKDETTAIYWYRKSARQGYISAQNRLKEMDIDWLETDE